MPVFECKFFGKFRNKQILLPGIGWVKYRRSRFMEGKPKNVTVSRRADGWYVSIQTEFECVPPENQGDAVGLDMGVKRFCRFILDF